MPNDILQPPPSQMTLRTRTIPAQALAPKRITLESSSNNIIKGNLSKPHMQQNYVQQYYVHYTFNAEQRTALLNQLHAMKSYIRPTKKLTQEDVLNTPILDCFVSFLKYCQSYAIQYGAARQIEHFFVQLYQLETQFNLQLKKTHLSSKYEKLTQDPKSTSNIATFLDFVDQMNQNDDAEVVSQIAPDTTASDVEMIDVSPADSSMDSDDSNNSDDDTGDGGLTGMSFETLFNHDPAVGDPWLNLAINGKILPHLPDLPDLPYNLAKK